MRKRLMVLLMAVMMVVMSAAPAMAASGKPKPAQPLFPPGRDIGQGMEPEQAADPQTGRINRFESPAPNR
jgi:hypothetical protein